MGSQWRVVAVIDQDVLIYEVVMVFQKLSTAIIIDIGIAISLSFSLLRVLRLSNGNVVIGLSFFTLKIIVECWIIMNV